jgi:hypothetical protein
MLGRDVIFSRSFAFALSSGRVSCMRNCWLGRGGGDKLWVHGVGRERLMFISLWMARSKYPVG